RFPKEKAAEIAVAQVKKFLEQDSTIKRVVFNVFTSADESIYRRLLG
ncbi:MAG: protein-ADP-ribose hydrolase, partial [Firmicutes bacterium]|nr:protein-ADP-ribose hydrolase [Bacillota bacterium]